MAVATYSKLIQMLLDEGIVTEEQVQEAVKVQQTDGISVEQALVKLGYTTNDVLTAFMGTSLDMATVNFSELGELDVTVVKLIPETFAQKNKLIAIGKVGAKKIKVAVCDPSNLAVLDELKIITCMDVEAVLATEEEIRQALTKYYGSTSEEMQALMKDLENVEEVEVIAGEEELDASGLAKASEEAPVIKLVSMLLNEAVRIKASDIHIEPFEKKVRTRLRIDGMLKEIQSHPKKMHAAVVSRIKIISGLDIAERRKPQDGRCKTKVGDREIDMRVSILPVVHGEKVVIRVLDSSNLQLDLSMLGFEPDVLQTYKKHVEVPYGMILVTGPTGSGKSVTLYSTLALLNNPTENISTVEDPVEFVTPGINQVNVNVKAGLTFAGALRAFLRQDPDIIMVGEIRDSETALIAINAALTGHKVFSTLHTNDSTQVITRLSNMGVEPFLITSSLVMATAQRLLRKICPKCKSSYEVQPEVLKSLGMKNVDGPMTLFRGMGCSFCANTGYKGRVAVYEVMVMNDELRAAALARKSGDEIKAIARQCGLVTLREAALLKVKQGVTTIEEVLRTTLADV